jgi:hypothetical protein
LSGLSFDDLVAVAALGVARKGFAAAELDGPAAGYANILDSGDPAAALLDAAALLTVAERAGVQPPRAPSAPGGPEPSTVPIAALNGASERELSARGARLLARMGGLGRQRGLTRNSGELLGDLLAAMRDAGYVLPAPLLPELLDIASRSPVVRPLVVPVLGARGLWLAGHRADWRQAIGAVSGDDRRGVGAAAGDEGGPEAWRVGTPGERWAYLAALRERDPRAGRELLAAGWGREAKEERARLLGALARGLSADDEEFLEDALGDRAVEVREAARTLLAWLPGSAFSRRCAERAAGALRLAGHGRDVWLTAHVPDDVDKAAARDGIELRAPARLVDAQAWRLSQLIAGAPLADWTTRLGMTPAEIVALPVEGAAAVDVRGGWRLAVVQEAAARRARAQQPPAAVGSAPAGTSVAAGPGGAGAASHPRTDGNAADPELADWAFALLSADGGTVNRPLFVWVPDAVLAGLLPAGLRAGRAAAMLADVSADARLPQVQPVTAELASHPVPWPPVLADAALDTLARAAARPALTELTQAVLDTAGRGMPATGEKDYAAELTRLADAMPQAWMPELLAAAETIALRRAFLAELR